MKKTMIILGSVVFALQFFSCAYYAKKRFHIGKELSFKSRSDYYHFLVTKKHFDSTHILYPDQSTLDKFIFLYVSTGSAIYLGTFLNDSVALKNSPLLQDNPSCLGRVLKEVDDHAQHINPADTSLLQKSGFNDVSYRYFNKNQPFHLSDSKRNLKVMLFYSSFYGTYYNSFYKEAMSKYASDKNAELYIIAIDYDHTYPGHSD